MQDFTRRIRKELPELIIENCSSGGHRLEPSFMAICAQGSFSDAHETLSITDASRHGASFIDTQAAFDRVLGHVHPVSLDWDRIHPGPVGHMVIARAFLDSFAAL